MAKVIPNDLENGDVFRIRDEGVLMDASVSEIRDFFDGKGEGGQDLQNELENALASVLAEVFTKKAKKADVAYVVIRIKP